MTALPDRIHMNRRWSDYLFIGIIAPVMTSVVIPFLRTTNGEHLVDASISTWQGSLTDTLYLFIFTGILFMLGLYVVKHIALESVLVSVLLGLLVTGAGFVLYFQREMLQIGTFFEGNEMLHGLAFLFYCWLLIYRTIRLSKWELTTTGLAVAGLLIAMSIALGRVGITTPVVRITFTFLPNALIGLLFGPWVGGVALALTDILSFIIGGGAGGFFPGFTLSALLTGIIYGLFLHRKQVTLKRVIAAEAVIALFVNLVLNTTWIYILTQNPLAVILPPRLIQNAVMFVVRTMIIWFIVQNKQLKRVFMKYSTAKS